MPVTASRLSSCDGSQFIMAPNFAHPPRCSGSASSFSRARPCQSIGQTTNSHPEPIRCPQSADAKTPRRPWSTRIRPTRASSMLIWSGTLSIHIRSGLCPSLHCQDSVHPNMVRTVSIFIWSEVCPSLHDQNSVHPYVVSALPILTWTLHVITM